MQLAPITLFVYNRLWHTRQTVEALFENELASSSKLFVFSDGPKGDQDSPAVQEVRDYISCIRGFAGLEIVERDKNWGLADNIIDGVSRIVNEYGRIIVLEDDLVTSPYFLRFMNEALEFYKDEPRVWHISGWNYPIDPEGLPETFLWRAMNCWGWATWADRWQYFEKNEDKIMCLFTKKKKKSYFNLDGYNNVWRQLVLNKQKKINTWAVFWYAKIVENERLCLNPSKSFVNNIGLDNTGTNCGKDNKNKHKILNYCSDFQFTNKIYEHKLVVDEIKKHLKNKGISKYKKLIKFLNNKYKGVAS